MRSGAAAWCLAATLSCAAAIVTVVVTLRAVYRLHVPLPYWDEWSTIVDFRHLAEGRYGLEDLTAQHNEHRLLFPRLVFFADEALFALSGLLDATVTLLLQAVNAALLIAWMTRLVAQPASRALLAGFVVLLLFTLRQEQNFTNGFQLQFVGVFTAMALAGAAYAAALDRMRHARSGSAPLFVLAALGCGVATYTMANGVLAGPVLAAMAVLHRACWRVPAATIVLSAALATLFFHGYVAGGDSLPLAQAVARPVLYLRYLAVYLGNPLGPGIRAAQALGALGLLLAVAAACRVGAGRSRDPASSKLLALAGFVVASAAATAYGRIALGIEQASESRYATPAMLFWCAILLFWVPVVIGSGRRRLAGAALGAVMALLAGAALVAEATAWPALVDRATAIRRVADSLVSDLYDADAAGTYENTAPDDIAALVPFLREHRLAAFADPDVAALGRPLSVLGSIAAPDACQGSVAARADATLGLRGVGLNGTASDGAAGGVPDRIIVANVAGTVVGFGSTALSRPARSWSAYAVAGQGEPLQAYGRLGDGTLCRLGVATVE